MPKILLVEDDMKLNNAVNVYLANQGYEVASCYNGKEGLDKFENEKFDLLLTDIMMPQMDGFQLAEEIRSYNKLTPILFMTARDDLPSKQKGYQIGIDDYLTKPFDLAELDLRIKAILRRAKIETSKEIKIGDFLMNQEEHAAYHEGEELPLSVREFDILYKLLSYPKKTFSRPSIMEEFWGYDTSATSRAVDVAIAELRKKVANCSEFDIVTVHGLGYKAILK